MSATLARLRRKTPASISTLAQILDRTRPRESRLPQPVHHFLMRTAADTWSDHSKNERANSLRAVCQVCISRYQPGGGRWQVTLWWLRDAHALHPLRSLHRSTQPDQARQLPDPPNRANKALVGECAGLCRHVSPWSHQHYYQVCSLLLTHYCCLVLGQSWTLQTSWMRG